MGYCGLCSFGSNGVEMTKEEEEALFRQRVRQINRDCLATFLPYIKMVISILLVTAAAVISGVVYYAQDMRADVRSLFTTATENRAILINVQSTVSEHTQQIIELQRKRR